MDNFTLKIQADLSDPENLRCAVRLAMGERLATGWAEHNDGLVVFDILEGNKFPYPHSSLETAAVCHEWLQRAAIGGKERGHTDHVGSNGHAFLLTVGDWGHAENSYGPEDRQEWENGLFFIRPVAAWYGK